MYETDGDKTITEGLQVNIAQPKDSNGNAVTIHYTQFWMN